jgi:hypothetical protein
MSQQIQLPTINDLPYPILNNNQLTQTQIITKLSQIVGISPHILKGAGQDGIDALVGTIMYRHLDRIQKMNVMSIVTNLQNGLAVQALRGKITDILVQPDWGLWSLSNDELIQKKELHAIIDQYATWLGVGISVSSIKGIFSDLWKKRSFSKMNLAYVVILISLLGSKETLNSINSELDNRSSLKDSKLYH